MAENSEDTAGLIKAFTAADANDVVVVVYNSGEVYDYLNYRRDYVTRVQGSPALVLLSLNVENEEGLEMMRMIKPQLSPRNIPTVVLASAYEENLARESYELGVNSFIVKPANFLDCVNVIKNLVGFWVTLNERSGG